MKRDYLDVVYNQTDRPLTNYPDKLSHYLFERFKLNKGQNLLDIGCGRGEFLAGFKRCGLRAMGVDRSNAAGAISPDLEIYAADLEKDSLPFNDCSFDVVFSKSVIEHFYYPEKLFEEIYRVMKPGGLVITLCPDWEFNYKIYYEDYTHRTPFTLTSLRDIQLITGFDQVHCERFRQLPILWKYRWLLPIAELSRIFLPAYLKKSSKFIRFSKEIMLLSVSIRP